MISTLRDNFHRQALRYLITLKGSEGPCSTEDACNVYKEYRRDRKDANFPQPGG